MPHGGAERFIKKPHGGAKKSGQMPHPGATLKLYFPLNKLQMPYLISLMDILVGSLKIRIVTELTKAPNFAQL